MGSFSQRLSSTSMVLSTTIWESIDWMKKKYPNVNELFKQEDTCLATDWLEMFLIDSLWFKRTFLCHVGIYHKDASAEKSRKCQSTRSHGEGGPEYKWTTARTGIQGSSKELRSCDGGLYRGANHSWVSAIFPKLSASLFLSTFLPAPADILFYFVYFTLLHGVHLHACMLNTFDSLQPWL